MNDFVNPQLRGVNLPPGFKDLADVLAAKNVLSPERSIYALHSNRPKPLLERYESNGLKHAEKFVRKFLESSSKMVTLTFFPKRGQVAFTLVRFPDLAKAAFCFSKEELVLERNVREIFAEFMIVPLSDASFLLTKHRVVDYSVPCNVPELLKIVTEILRLAFEVSESDGLGFRLHEK